MPDDSNATPSGESDEPAGGSGRADADAGISAEPLPPTRRERARAAVDHARERLDAKRQTSMTFAVAYDTFGRDADAGGPVLAAALGFRVFLFMVPYVGFFVIIAGYAADLFDTTPQQMFKSRGIAALTAKGITTGHDLSTSTRITALVFVTYALFLSARSFVKVLRIVHALVWRTTPGRLRNPTRATLIFIAVVSVAMILAALIDALTHRVVTGGVAALVLYTLVPFAVWWVVSWWLPHADCDVLGLAAGAAIFAIGAQVLHVVTLVWFPYEMQNKSEVYGTLGTAIALLLWAYLLGRLITLAAVVNVEMWRRRSSRPPSPPAFVVKLPFVGDRLGRLWTRSAGQSEDNAHARVDPPAS